MSYHGQLKSDAVEVMSDPHRASATTRIKMLKSLEIPTAEKAPVRRSKTKVLLLALVLIQAAGLAYLSVAGSPFDKHSAPPVIMAQAATSADPAPATAAAIPDDVPPPAAAELVAQGYVTATRIATVSSRVTGVIAAINVEVGQIVTAGEVLGQLDTKDAELELSLMQAQLAARRASLKSAKAQRDAAALKLDHETSLLKRGFSTEALIVDSRTQFDTAVAAFESAQAEVALGEIQVARTQLQLDDHTIRAPFDGIVIERMAQPGEVLSPNGAGGAYTRTGLCTIVDMHSREIVVDVNERLIGQVNQGQPVLAELYAYDDLTVKAEVLQITPNVDRAKATVRVRLRLLSDDPRILPDMGVKVSFL